MHLSAAFVEDDDRWKQRLRIGTFDSTREKIDISKRNTWKRSCSLENNSSNVSISARNF